MFSSKPKTTVNIQGVIDILNIISVLVKLSIAVIKYHGHKQLREEGFISTYISKFAVHKEGKSE